MGGNFDRKNHIVFVYHFSRCRFGPYTRWSYYYKIIIHHYGLSFEVECSFCFKTSWYFTGYPIVTRTLQCIVRDVTKRPSYNESRSASEERRNNVSFFRLRKRYRTENNSETYTSYSFRSDRRNIFFTCLEVYAFRRCRLRSNSKRRTYTIYSGIDRNRD